LTITHNFIMYSMKTNSKDLTPNISTSHYLLKQAKWKLKIYLNL
jgi:hypothetical protein